MNVLRKAMAGEVEAFRPILDEAYTRMARFQRSRTGQDEAAMRSALGPAIERLMTFRPLLPAYKQSDFRLLDAEWRRLPASDLIMLFDHCISIMHVHLERRDSTAKSHQHPWSGPMLRLLDSYRASSGHLPIDGDYLCSGIPASGGKAAGQARVIHDEIEFDALRPGDILVCRFTSPELVPYFRTISALVTDQGGALSHAAIIAREFSLPAVTGCGDATTAIETGSMIHVDGNFGIVTAVERGSA